MDTAFYNRTGFTAGHAYNEINFYPGGGQNYWLQRIHPFVFAKAGHDYIQDGHETSSTPASAVQFHAARHVRNRDLARQRGLARPAVHSGNDVFMFGRIQAMRWLGVFGGGGIGPGIYYDEVDPFQGRSFFSFYGFTLQPNQHLTQSSRATSTGSIASQPASGSTSHGAQLEDHVSVRQALPVSASSQYDSSEHRVLTDLWHRMIWCRAPCFMPAMGRSSSAVRRAVPERRELPGASRRELPGDESRILLQGVLSAEVLNLTSVFEETRMRPPIPAQQPVN